MVFAVAAAVPAYLALRGGGYDLTIRQEAGLVIWAALIAGIGFGVLPRGRLTWLVGAPLAAIAGLLVLNLLSLDWTGSSEHTFAEVARIVVYAGVVALALLGLNRYTWRAAALGLGAAAAVVCVVALASRLSPGSFHNPVADAFATDRLSYPLNYWNAVAAWGSMTIAMGLAWSANSRRLWLRCAGLAAVPVAGLTVYLTYSRAGVAGTVVAILAVVALSRNRWTAAVHAAGAALATAAVILVARGEDQIAHATGSAGAGSVILALLGAVGACAAVAAVTAAARVDDVRIPSRMARLLIPIGVVVAALALAVGGHGPASHAWHQFQHQRTVSAGDNPTGRLATAGGTRHDIWDTAFDAFDAHPLDGIGPGTFEFWWAEHGKGTEFVRDAHSLYIEELAELGLPGVLLLLAFLGTTLGLAIRGRFRARRSSEIAAATAMCAAGTVFLVHAGLDWMWEETAVGVLGIGAMAVGAAALIERRRRRPAWLGARGALTAAAGIAALLLVPGLVSSSREGQSEQLLRQGQVAKARMVADQAINAEPWAATPYQQRAAVEDRAGHTSLARDDLEHAISNEPADWRQHLQLAQVQLELGDDSAAHRQYNEAQRRNKVSFPFASFEEFRRANASGCLVLGPLECTTGSLISESSCHPVPGAFVGLLHRYNAAGLRHLIAVRTLDDPNSYYVAARASSGVALWFADRDAFLNGQGFVVPLNAAALSAATLRQPLDRPNFLALARSINVRTALACESGDVL